MKIASFCFLLCLSLFAHAEIKTETLEYAAGETKLKGYIAWDTEIKEARPGVLVVHEWWGHNQHARNKAIELAKMGYTALAIDMYGDGKTASHPDDAAKYMKETFTNMDVARARFMAAYDLLNNHPTTNPEKNAAIGYCFGGGVVLNMARAGVDLDGVVSFHGNYAAKIRAKKQGIKAKMFVAHGEDDKFINQMQVDAFKLEMQQVGGKLEFISYPGAKHSFTNPESDKFAKEFNIPIGYDAAADKQSWADMSRFLKQVFAD